jgi:hypothetical protein
MDVTRTCHGDTTDLYNTVLYPFYIRFATVLYPFYHKQDDNMMMNRIIHGLDVRNPDLSDTLCKYHLNQL